MHLEIKIDGRTAIMVEDKEAGLFTMYLLEKGGPIITGKTKEECLEKFKEAMGLAIVIGKWNAEFRKKLEVTVDEVLEAYLDKVNNYKLGKTGLMGLFAGEVMKRMKGKADPKELITMIKDKIDKIK